MAVSYKQYAILSNAVYRDEDFISPENYEFKKIKYKDMPKDMPKDLEMSDDSTGFYAAAYENENKEAVIAYRGSDNRLNYWHDLIMSAGKKPPELDKAMEFYDVVEAYCKNNNLSLVGMTGHSLGGSMVQFVNAKLAIERGYQIEGFAFAPAGIGRLFPGLDVSSIAVKNFIRKGDWIPWLMNEQLGNPEWTEYLSRKDQSYSVQYTEGIGEVLSRSPGVFAQHSMLGYLVDVAHLPTIPAGNREALAEYCRKAKYFVDNGIKSDIEMDKQIAIQMFAQDYSRDNIRHALENASAGLSVAKDPAQYIEEILRTNLIVNRYATGGHLESGQVSGPGAGTSDSILAWLGNKGKFIKISNGEYVIRANAVQKWGTNFLDSINSGLIPQELYNGKGSYATGGSISDNSVKKPQENLGGAFRNLALTVIQSIQNYAKELIKKIMSGLGLDTAASKSSDPWTLSNGARLPQDFGFKRDANSSILGLPSGRHMESAQVEQKADVLFSMEKGLSAAPQPADYNRELAKTPTLLDRIHEASKNALEDGLSSFLSKGILQCKSLGDAFRNLAISILQSIQKIYAQAMTENIMSMLGLGATPKTPSSKPVLGTTASNGFYYDPTFGIKLGAAEGGHIQGPGTSTSDSILSWLSNGEFVIKASSVQKYGTNFLHSLNSGFLPNNLMPRFATGGLVGASVEGATGIANNIQGGDVTVPLKVVNVTDPNEVGRYLMTRPGERIMVNFMKNNAGTMRQILNIKG